jgi:GNAT superfamily N-acetyltransferase
VSTDLLIRPCTEKDTSDLVRLNLEFMQEVMDSNPYWTLLERPSAEDMGRTIMHALDVPDKIQIFVAELNDEIIGYANTWTVYSIWSGGLAMTIDDLYISARHRKRGMGEEIMQYLTQYAEQHDYKRIQLQAEPGNHKAHGLYKKMGFKDEAMTFFMKPI